MKNLRRKGRKLKPMTLEERRKREAHRIRTDRAGKIRSKIKVMPGGEH